MTTSLKSVSVGFFTPIDWPRHPKNCLFAVSVFADLYFFFGGTVAEIDTVEKDYCEIDFRTYKNDEPLWFTIAKVISYATIILPLIALVIKAVVRCSYNFVVDKNKTDEVPEEEQPIQSLPKQKIGEVDRSALDEALRNRYFENGLEGADTQSTVFQLIDLLNRTPEEPGGILKLDIHEDLEPIGLSQGFQSTLSGHQSKLGRILSAFRECGLIRDFVPLNYAVHVYLHP